MEPSRPNIVFMLLDNVGYGDPGCYGGGITRMAPTPRVDGLAAQGLRLTNFNVEAECTPTRAALLTGRMPIRTGCDRVRFGEKNGLAPWEYTLAHLLADVGYDTAIYGKWHLGNVPERHPTAMGFGEWYGIQDSTDPVFDHFNVGKGIRKRSTQIWEGTAGAPAVPVGEYTPEARRLIDAEVTDRACRFIADHAGGDRPFFLYVPFTMIHHPSLPHPDFAGRSGNGDFADSMMEVDHYSGRIIDAVDAVGIGGDTIVVWASDNGPPSHGTLGPQGDPGPFRGCLGTALEGQLRVPCVIRWPGHIEPGRVSDDIVSVLDFYVTFANLTGGRVPTDRAIDSLDIGPLLDGSGPSPREHLIAFVRDTLAAVKWHQYKLHLVEFTTEPGRRYKLELEFPQLYNVAADPKEQWDILGTNLWIAEVAQEIAADFFFTMVEFPNVPAGADAPPGVEPVAT